MGGELRLVSCSTLFAPSVLLEPESETVRPGSLEGTFRPRRNSFQSEVRGRDFVLGSQPSGVAPSSGTRNWSVRLGPKAQGWSHSSDCMDLWMVQWSKGPRRNSVTCSTP